MVAWPLSPSCWASLSEPQPPGARQSGESGHRELADTSRAPWLSFPPPEIALRHGVPGQALGQGKDLGSEGLGRAFCRPHGGVSGSLSMGGRQHCSSNAG